MAGKKGRSGKHRDPAHILKYFNDTFDLNSDSLIDELFRLALNGNKDILTYCFDRRLGRPHQSQDLRVTAKREYTPEELQLMRFDIAGKLDAWGEMEAIPEKTSSDDDIQA